MVSPTVPAGLSQAELFTVTAGGAESNVARHLAAMGFDTHWLSRLGDDALGDRILASLSESGVAVGSVTRDPINPTGVYFKDPRPDGRGAVSYYRSGSAASQMSPSDFDRWPFAGARWVHTTGITAALSASCDALVERIVESAASLHYGVSIDINYRPALWWTRELAAARCLQLGRKCQVVLVGLDEAQELWGISTAADVADLFSTVPTVVVKDGANEAIEILQTPAGSRTTHRVPAHKVEVVEAIGAGDAFAAGYLAGYLRGDSPEARLAAGHRLAAWTLGSLQDHRPMPAASTQPAAFTQGASAPS